VAAVRGSAHGPAARQGRACGRGHAGDGDDGAPNVARAAVLCLCCAGQDRQELPEEENYHHQGRRACVA
jgi:hypothetical protein